METDYTAAMEKLSNAELIDLVTKHAADYRPEALAAAKAVLEKRDLPEEAYAAAVEEMEEKAAEKAAIAGEPLSDVYKALAFFLPLLSLFAAGVIYFSLRSGGFTTKAKDFVKWTVYGLLFYFGVAYVLYLFQQYSHAST